MNFDKRVSCSECENTSCKRRNYLGEKICKKFMVGSNRGSERFGCDICTDFKLQSYYFHSPSYKDFTLDDYIIYQGIYDLECKMTDMSNLITVHDKDKYVFDKYRYTFDNSRSFHYGRDKDYKKYYRIYKGDKILKHYINYQSWWNGEGILDDWIDICRNLYYRKRDKDYEKQAKEAFFSGQIIIFTDDKKFKYVVDYKDWFYNENCKPIEKYKNGGLNRSRNIKWIKCGEE